MNIGRTTGEQETRRGMGNKELEFQTAEEEKGNTE